MEFLNKKNKSLAVFVILALTFFSFLPTLGNEFVNWDDLLYIQKNFLIHQLSFSNTVKIFTTFLNGNYTPLTNLSFAIEWHFVGLHPFLYHLNNVLLHVMNTFLVYIFISKLSKDNAIALIVMLLFGIHPMRVESVAWITERKDVLYALFFLLGLIFYLNHEEKNETGEKSIKIFWVYLFYIMSLISKPAAIPLPLILILIDWWRGRQNYLILIREKIPFFIISIIFLGIGYIGAYGSVGSNIETFSELLYVDRSSFHFNPYTWYQRIALCNGCLLIYIGRIIWCFKLSCFYPHINNDIPIIFYWSLFAWLYFIWTSFKKQTKSKPIIFGLLFFIFIIFLNLPFKSFSPSSLIGERFTYIPYIGLFFILAFPIKKFLFNNQINLKTRIFIPIILVSFLIIQTRQECRVWKNGVTLWANVVNIFPHSRPFLNLANAYSEKNLYHLALKNYDQSLTFNPTEHEALTNKAATLFYLGNLEEAIKIYSYAIKLYPQDVVAFANRGITYAHLGEYDKMLQDFNVAKQLDSANLHVKKLEGIIAYINSKR